MGSKSGGGDQVVQRSTSEPWSGASPHLKGIMGEAAQLYKSGKGPSYYPGATHIGPTSQEMQGMGQIEGLAKGGNPLLPGLMSQAGSMMSGGGLSDEMRQSLSPLFDIASGKDSISVTQPGASNPYLMDVLNTSAGKAADSVNSSLSGMGRYGSGAHQGVLSREVGNIYSSGLSNQMNTDLDRRMQAEAGNIANRAGATGQLLGTYGQGADRAMGYASMAPQLDDMRYRDSQRLIDVGAAQRGEQQGQLGDQIARYDAKQSRDWDMLDLYSKMVGGMGGMGSSQTTTNPRGSPLAGILGGASLGAGIGGPWGGLLGGLGGGLLA